ncbi:YopX family protein [Streptococcus salivarius]
MILRYRAWLKEDKEMIEVEEMNFYNGELDFIGDGITWMCKSNDCVLMQSTGLRDKNGKEIFEGDIVKVTNLSSWLEVVSFNEDKAMFVSKEIKREIEESPLYDLFNTDIFEVEIVGNIYTNPELAEVSS